MPILILSPFSSVTIG